MSSMQHLARYINIYRWGGAVDSCLLCRIPIFQFCEGVVDDLSQKQRPLHDMHQTLKEYSTSILGWHHNAMIADTHTKFTKLYGAYVHVWTCSLACGQYVKPLTCRNSWFSAAGRLLAASNIFCSHGSKFLRPWALVYCAISLPYVLYLYISYIYTCDDMCVGIPDSNLQLLSWLQYYCGLDWRRKIHDLASAIKHPSFYYNLSNCTSVNTIQGLQNPTVEVWKQTRAKQDLHTFDCLDLDGPLERPELSKNQLRCLGMFGADHVMTSKTTPLVWT